MKQKLLDLIADYAQEVKDFGYLDNSPTLAVLQSFIDSLNI